MKMNLLRWFFATLLTSITVYVTRKYTKRIAMTFFRDLSRYKSRKRLYGNSAALIPLLMGNEEPAPLKFNDTIDDSFTMTVDQLSEMDGSTEDTPIYLSVKGRIFDVSAARAMYGPSGSYHGFVGRDASRAFATGCTEDHCFTSNIEGLTEAELKEIDRWVELYMNHDKYTYVGRLVGDHLDELVSHHINNDSKEEDERRQHEQVEDEPSDRHFAEERVKEAIEAVAVGVHRRVDDTVQASKEHAEAAVKSYGEVLRNARQQIERVVEDMQEIADVQE